VVASPSSPPPRLLIVEDDSETREYLVECLHGEGGYRVSGAGTLDEGMEYLRTLQPDMALIDLGLPDGSGLDLIRCASELNPEVQVLVISAFGDERSLIAALEAGARGYLLKSETPADVRLAVRQVREGGAPISPGIASHLLERFRPAEAPGPVDPSVRLTQRELEVLEFVVQGLSHQETADVLDIRRDTVAAHVKSIYRKLEVHSRGEATFQALRQGLVRVPKDDS